MTEVGNNEFLTDKIFGFCIDSNQPAKEKLKLKLVDMKRMLELTKEQMFLFVACLKFQVQINKPKF